MKTRSVPKVLYSAKKVFSLVKSPPRPAFASACFPLHWKRRKFGTAMAARMPMIATTIISSMRVKPSRGRRKRPGPGRDPRPGQYPIGADARKTSARAAGLLLGAVAVLHLQALVHVDRPLVQLRGGVG